MTALSANLVASKERYPNRTALRCDDLQFSYAEFDAAAARAATLSHGWRPPCKLFGDPPATRCVPSHQCRRVVVAEDIVLRGHREDY